MKKYLFIVLLTGVCFGQLAKRSYVDYKINNLKFDLENKITKEITKEIRELEKKLSKNTKHIAQIYPNGTPKLVFIYSKNGELEGNQPFIKLSKISYEANGNIKDIINYYENGEKKQLISYNGGIKSGLYKEWYDYGKKKIEGNLKNGQLDGTYKEWFSSGVKKIEAEYNEGYTNGLYTKWYGNGQKNVQGMLQNNKEEGKWIIWNSDGTILEEQYYLSGTKTGQWTVYAKNGKVKQLTKYVDGNVENVEKFNSDGSLIEDSTEVCIQTKFGQITLQLFPNLAPKHVESFKLHAKNGYYDGTTFHRVIPGFMIQGGDPLSKLNDKSKHGTGGHAAKYFGIGDENSKSSWDLPAEFSETPHERGILSMARSKNPDSGGSQFFICVADAKFLDNQYTVFGKVIGGMDVVDAIVSVPRDARDNPNERVEMKFISCQ